MPNEASMSTAGTSLTADRNSVVTYRHLLSKQTLGPSNPLRVIAHCDIDAAYAQFEMVRLGLSPETPVACQQWSGLIAINYPARSYGITRHMTVQEALKKCPDLVAVHVATYKEGEDQAGYWPDAKPETHKVSLEPFRRESLKILKVFADSCPTIEKASIDEAYLDFTLPVRDMILERNPHLGTVPAGSQLGLDTPLPPPPPIDWEPLGNIVPVLAEGEELAVEKAEAIDSDDKKPKQEEAIPSSQIIEQPSDPVNAWSDYALSLGAELMQKCRREVLQQLGYTCSAGVARNKILAKLCSAYRKPNAQTILRNDAIASFLRPLKFTKIRSLGGKLGASIAEEYDAATVGDLWDVPLRDLQAKFGIESGSWVYNVLRGVEHGEVAAKTDVKSMLSSKNFKPSLRTWEEITYWLRIIATDLYARLNEARDVNPGVWPKTIVLGVRDDKYQNRHRQAAFPMTSTLTVDYVLKCGEKLMKDFIAERRGIGIITNLQLSFSGLERAEKGQRGIQGFFGAGNAVNDSARASPAPVAATMPSAKALGKRKANSTVVDLTLDDASDEDEAVVGASRSGSSTAGTSLMGAPTMKRNKSGDSVTLDDGDNNDSDTDIEVLDNVVINGPIYQCPRCAAIVNIIIEGNEDSVTARKRAEKAHKLWHEKYSASNGAADKRKKDKPPKKKRKGQQKLKSFFKKG